MSRKVDHIIVKLQRKLNLSNNRNEELAYAFSCIVYYSIGGYQKSHLEAFARLILIPRPDKLSCTRLHILIGIIYSLPWYPEHNSTFSKNFGLSLKSHSGFLLWSEISRSCLSNSRKISITTIQLLLLYIFSFLSMDTHRIIRRRQWY